jgi:hypothetical protein
MMERIFRSGWMTIHFPGMEMDFATYVLPSWDSLPPLDVPAGIQWLAALSSVAQSPITPDAEPRKSYATSVRDVLAAARRLNIELPTSFCALMQNESLQDRIPSPTACYLDLPQSVAPSPFEQGAHILRFLNDQQCCICWYLYFPAVGDPFVISSFPLARDDAFFLEDIDAEDCDAVSAAKDSTLVAAPSFDAFLYRFWFENTLWFKLNDNIALNQTEKDYLNHLIRAFGAEAKGPS